MRMARALAALAIIVTPVGAAAQGYPVTGGEHAGFTRVVVHAPPGIDWSLQSEGRRRTLVVTPARAGFDLGRLFDRIARTRLSGAETSGASLTLVLGCDCAVSAWEERPGLIVLDIADPVAEQVAILAAQDEPPTEDRIAATSPAPVRPLALSPSVAQSVGASLARQHAASEPLEPDPPPIDREALMRNLGLPLAHALSQGLLEPAAGPQTGAGLLRESPPPAVDLPDNLRITATTERPDPDLPPVGEPRTDCPRPDILEFLLDPSPEPFATAFARLSRQLYGEFDQPDRAAQQALVELYLSAGFGAEARRLLDAGTDPVSGRDLMLGIADVLEDRNSNSRMRLAETFDCGGPVAIFALLAGGERESIPGDALALTFTQFPARLRAAIGADLAERLVGAGKHDAARIIAESLRRSAWTDPADMARVDSDLARARGQTDAAAARLAQLPPGASDTQTVQRRLDLALETAQPMAVSDLEAVEALASAERGSRDGSDLMASVIRLHARDGRFRTGFDALDRLRSWLPLTGANAALIADLGDQLWASLADSGSDLELISQVLARDDWTDPQRTAQTRFALAERLIDLGLAPPVIQLIPEPRTETESVLRARAALELGQPEAAITYLDPHDGVAAQATLAAAYEAMDRPDAAARSYAALGAHEAAARAAIAARDWDRLREIQAEYGSNRPERQDLNALLGLAPGRSGAATQPRPVGGTRAEPAVGPVPDSADAGTAPTPPAGDPDLGDNPPRQARPAPDPEAGPPSEPVARAGVNAVQEAPVPAIEAPAPAAIETETSADLSPGGPDDRIFAFDRMGLVSRSAVLLSESERLRAAIAPLLEDAR